MVKLVEESGINMPLYARYVDDGNTLMEAFRRGWRWVDEEKRLMWKKEWENEDEEIGEEDDKRCFREWRRLCNRLLRAEAIAQRWMTSSSCGYAPWERASIIRRRPPRFGTPLARMRLTGTSTINIQ